MPGEHEGEPWQGPDKGDFWTHVHRSIMQEDGPHLSLVNDLHVAFGKRTQERFLKSLNPTPTPYIQAEQSSMCWDKEFILTGPSPDPTWVPNWYTEKVHNFLAVV